MDITTLYNLALDKVGARSNISLPIEQSPEAEACNLWFPIIRDQVLASAPWPEATKMARLALASAQDDDTWNSGEPRPDLANTYLAPSDMLQPQYFADFQKFTVQSYGTEQLCIMSNASQPVLIYTFQQYSMNVWSQGLFTAVMLGVAANICVKLTGKTSRAKVLLDEANAKILAAREDAANTNFEQLDFLPDWIAARGYADAQNQTRFFYPYGALLIAANVS